MKPPQTMYGILETYTAPVRENPHRLCGAILLRIRGFNTVNTRKYG